MSRGIQTNLGTTGFTNPDSLIFRRRRSFRWGQRHFDLFTFPLNDLIYPFFYELPGSMKSLAAEYRQPLFGNRVALARAVLSQSIQVLSDTLTFVSRLHRLGDSLENLFKAVENSFLVDALL